MVLILSILLSQVLIGGVHSPAEMPNDVLQKYVGLLNSLDKTDPDSVGKATAEFTRNIAPLDITSRDKAFVEFLIFYSRVCDGIREKLESEFGAKYEKVPESERATLDWEKLFCAQDFKEQLKENGMWPLPDFEERPQVAQKPEYALVHFGEFISPPLRKYLELRKPELTKKWSQDASIGISRDELAARVRKWEQYTEDYPGSPLVQDAQVLFKSYFPSFLQGEGNCPVFEHSDDDTYKANPEDIARFRKYAKDNPKSFSGRKVADFMELVEKSDYGLSPGVDLLLVKIREEMDNKFASVRAIDCMALLNKIIY